MRTQRSARRCISGGGRRAGLVLLGVVALLVAGYGSHRTRSASTGAPTAGHGPRRAHVDRSGPALSSIAGTIRDDDNTPLLHARVCAQLTGGPTQCTTADERGAYAIDDLVAGKYQIAAIADRHLPMRPDELVLGLGEHRGGVDLVLLAGGVEITGTVSDLGGGPIARAEVYAATFASVETDDGGRFHMSVWPGHIGVYAVADGYATAYARNTAPGTFDLVMMRAGTLGGVVLDARTRTPVVGAHVSLPDRGFGDEVTDADGRFQFEGLSPDRRRRPVRRRARALTPRTDWPRRSASSISSCGFAGTAGARVRVR